jgi:hypothetical protein
MGQVRIMGYSWTLGGGGMQEPPRGEVATVHGETAGNNNRTGANGDNVAAPNKLIRTFIDGRLDIRDPEHLKSESSS